MSEQKFFLAPWAVTGDRTAIPNPVQGTGAVSYTQGWGPDYERDPETDPAAKRLPRDESNQVLYDITDNLREYQNAGFPEWITAAQNGGTPVPYPINAYVRWNGGTGEDWVVYASNVVDNASEPGTNGDWLISAPVDPASLRATQAQTNDGTGTGLVGSLELVKAAREGKWSILSGVAYATPNDLTAAYPGSQAWTQVQGTVVVFAVPVANSAAPLTLKVGDKAAAPLRTSQGRELFPADLLTGALYEARFTGSEWRLNTNVPSELASAGANGDGSIFGMITSNTAGLVATHLNVGIGQCRDSLNRETITLSAPITKRLDQVWALGNANGGRDVAAVPLAKSSWHIYVIRNPTTRVVDALLSQSATAPALPAGFTQFRRIGAVILDAAAAIQAYLQTGDFFRLKTGVTEYNAAPNGGAPFLRRLNIPQGVKMEGEFYYCSTTEPTYGPASAPGTSGIHDPDLGSPVGFGGWGQIRFWTTNTGLGRFMCVMCRQFTDTAAQVYTVSSDLGDSIQLMTVGWRDDRGRFV